jgi:type I restriction-modification system DNA methylase subunit
MPIGTLIKSIQDIMRKDTGVDGDAQRISQIVWLLFLKIFDDKEQEWKTLDPKYKSPLPARFQWSNWAANPEGDYRRRTHYLHEQRAVPSAEETRDDLPVYRHTVRLSAACL